MLLRDATRLDVHDNYSLLSDSKRNSQLIPADDPARVRAAPQRRLPARRSFPVVPPSADDPALHQCHARPAKTHRTSVPSGPYRTAAPYAHTHSSETNSPTHDLPASSLSKAELDAFEPSSTSASPPRTPSRRSACHASPLSRTPRRTMSMRASTESTRRARVRR